MDADDAAWGDDCAAEALEGGTGAAAFEGTGAAALEVDTRVGGSARSTEGEVECLDRLFDGLGKDAAGGDGLATPRGALEADVQPAAFAYGERSETAKCN